MPWVSTPRRSAATREVAIIVAFSGGTPLASRREVAKERAFDGVTKSLGDGLDMVKCVLDDVIGNVYVQSIDR